MWEGKEFKETGKQSIKGHGPVTLTNKERRKTSGAAQETRETEARKRRRKQCGGDGGEAKKGLPWSVEGRACGSKKTYSEKKRGGKES